MASLMTVRVRLLLSFRSVTVAAGMTACAGSKMLPLMAAGCATSAYRGAVAKRVTSVKTNKVHLRKLVPPKNASVLCLRWLLWQSASMNAETKADGVWGCGSLFPARCVQDLPVQTQSQSHRAGGGR